MKFDVKVPKEFIWVMGDHRGASADSRFHTDDPNKGMVPIDRVTGRAVIVIWPLSNIGLIKRATDLASLPVLK
jgi:signal peptidase I